MKIKTRKGGSVPTGEEGLEEVDQFTYSGSALS